MEGEGSFFIPGAIVNLTVCDNHIYVMFCETSHTIEYCSDNIPAYADREGENDCPFEVKPKEWLAKTNLQVARLSYKSHGKWDIINVLRGNTPSSPFNEKYKFYFSHFLILDLSNYSSNSRISFLLIFCSFVNTNNLRCWTNQFSESYCSMSITHKIIQRFKGFRNYMMLQVSNNVVILNRPSSIMYIGVDQGLYVEDEVPVNYRSVRHPTLPLLFEYNSKKVTNLPSTYGKFVVTSEASHEEEAMLGESSLLLGNGIYNKYYEARFVTSNKKRLYDIDFEAQERHADEG